MKITITAIAMFTASCGPIEAGEVIGEVETVNAVETTRDLLSLIRSGEGYTLSSKLERGEVQSLLRTADKVYCDSDDPTFEAERDAAEEATEMAAEESAEAPAEAPPAPKQAKKKKSAAS